MLHIYCLRLRVALLLRPTGAGYVTYDAGVFVSIDLRPYGEGELHSKPAPRPTHSVGQLLEIDSSFIDGRM